MYTQTQQVQRIQSIQNTLRASIYHGKKRVESISGSRVCFRRLSYGEREKTLEDCAGWENYESGRLWGGSDQHFAFRAQFEIPKEYEAKEVVLQVSTGATDIWNTDNPQFIIYINGRECCAMDMNHNEVTLTENAIPEMCFDIGIYAYSNTSAQTNFLYLDMAVQMTW